MHNENVWLVSDSAVMAAVIEKEDALVSCLVVFSVQTERKVRKYRYM